jgi:hypothetical protein
MLLEAPGLQLLQESGVDFLAVDAQGQVYTRAGAQGLN